MADMGIEDVVIFENKDAKDEDEMGDKEDVGVEVGKEQEKEEEEGKSKVELTPQLGEDYGFIFEIARSNAKAEDDLDQIIAYLSNSGSKVEKVWDLHAIYQWEQIGCIKGQT